MEPVRIFIAGNRETKSREGTIQGEPTAMGAFTPGVIPLIRFLSNLIFIGEARSKEVAFADDFTVAGNVNKIKAYWKILQQLGSLFGYFPIPSTSSLIVKGHHYNKVVDVFMEVK